MALGKGIKAMLDTFVDSRVYVMQLPDTPEFPAIVMQRISGPRASILWRPRYQLSCWARSYKEAEELAENVTEALHGFHGDIDGTHGVILVESNGLDDYEPETGLYRRIVDIYLYHW